DLGMETMNVSTGANAIGHPMSLAIALAEMVLNNLFARFPGLRVAYLEGGPLWFLMALERLSRSYEAGTPINPRGELLHLPEGQKRRPCASISQRSHYRSLFYSAPTALNPWRKATPPSCSSAAPRVRSTNRTPGRSPTSALSLCTASRTT